MNSQTDQLKDFNFYKELEALLNNFQEVIYQYDYLISHMQKVVEEMDSPLSSQLKLVFKDILNVYYTNIKNKKRAINSQMYNISTQNRKINCLEEKLKHFLKEYKA